MEFNRIDGFISLGGDKFKFVSILWEKGKVESGYFSIGLPYLSANSEVFTTAYPLSILVNNRDFIYKTLSDDEVVESMLKNFYELGGIISFNTNGVLMEPKISELMEEESIGKILYCIFLINKINKDTIFYTSHMEKALQFMPSSDVELVLNKILISIFNILRVALYIIKIIPVDREVIRDSRSYREVVIWDLYQNYRSIMITDKIALHEGRIEFEDEYFGFYVLHNATPDLFIKPDLKAKATGYALALVMRKMGNSAFIYRPKINTSSKFYTLIFIVASRLLVLNQIYCIHGDLHAGNFVLEINPSMKYSNYIQCEDLYIYNNIDLYTSFDLIDFGNCIEMHEGDSLREFIKKVVPNIYNNKKETIDLLVKASPLDIAISATLLDLYYFIESFYNSSTEYEQIKDQKIKFQDYIIERFLEYLDNNSRDILMGGATSGDYNIHSSMPDTYDTDMFVGGDLNPNYNNRIVHHHINSVSLPIYKFLDHFYRDESNTLDKEKIFNPIK